MNRELVSIITVVYNSSSTLENTIKSVFTQNKKFFEYWIIDGGSTDGSIDIIRKYDHQLAGWVSEPDKGIYDAMNKGISRATGNWIYFLGADDSLEPEVLEKIYSYLNKPYKVVFGNVIFDNNKIFYSSLGLRTLMQNTLHHQSAFYHYSLFNDFKYDQSLAIQADYELNISIYMRQLPIKHVSLLIATCASGGISAGHSEQSLKEINLIRERFLKNHWQKVFIKFLLRLYYWQKQLRSWLYRD